MSAGVTKIVERKRWWVAVWLVWGLLCASIIAMQDRSWIAAAAWLVAGPAVGLLAFRMLGAFIEFVAPSGYWWRGKWHDDGESFEFEIRDEIHSPIVLGGREILPFLDPNRKPWEIVPIVAVGVGIVHGILLGGVVGALLPWSSEWRGPAWQGALLGAVCGVPAVGLLGAVATAVFVLTRKGPDIAQLENLLAMAEREAASQHREFVGAGDLLVTVLQHPDDALRKLLTSPSQLALAVEHVRGSISAELEYRDDGEFSIECDPTAIPSSAIDEASKLRHASVGAGHVLLALLGQWPIVTEQALDLAGVPPGDRRQQVLEFLPRDNN
ncbi:MAG TPA: hypothetical protein VJ783_13895 [Pirellulales bacterium]|nr:hypothetical protein [Pirellulales bacterium]